MEANNLAGAIIEKFLNEQISSGAYSEEKVESLQGKNKEFLVNGESFSRDLKKLSFLSSSISCGIKYKL